DQPSFAGPHTIVFRDTSSKESFLVRIDVDGSGAARIAPVIEKYGASPDGEWVAATVMLTKDIDRSDPLGVPYATVAVPTHGGSLKKLCNGACKVNWSTDGRFLYVFAGHTLVLPILAGQSLPDVPAAGISAGNVPSNLPGSTVIAAGPGGIISR